MNQKKLLATLLAVTGSLLIAGCEAPPATPPVPVPGQGIPPSQGIRTNTLSFEVLPDEPLDVSRDRLPEPPRSFAAFETAEDTVLWISLGQRPSTGYALRVVRVEDIEGVTKVTVSETTPPPGNAVGMMITYPTATVRYRGGTPRIQVVDEKGTVFPELHPATAGAYVGLADAHSMEIVLADGTARVFQFSDAIRASLEAKVLQLQKDDPVVLTYLQESGELVLWSLVKATK